VRRLRKKKLEELQVEYSKKTTDDADLAAARDRYLERKKIKEIGERKAEERDE